MVQDVRARKARGCDLAFADPVSVSIEGQLPGGGFDRVTVKVASLVPWLVMKGMALANRVKEKDAYDIYYCVRYHPLGPGGVGALVRPHLVHSLVREGLGHIHEKFRSVGHVGPRWVADFLEIGDPEERAVIQRQAYELVSAFLEAAGFGAA